MRQFDWQDSVSAEDAGQTESLEPVWPDEPYDEWVRSMAMRQFHVTYRDPGANLHCKGGMDKWFLLEVGVPGETPFRTKGAAVTEGRKIAIAAKGSLRIHKKDGKIETEWSYGKDPKSPG